MTTCVVEYDSSIITKKRPVFQHKERYTQCCLILNTRLNIYQCFEGPTSSLTVAAQRMLQRCVEKLAEKEEQLMKLEKQINPLLDDNDQVILCFVV